MHPREARKERNGTGRLAHICLRESRIQVGVDFSCHPEVNRLIQDPDHYAFILYPGKDALNIQNFPFARLSEERKRPLMFVLDGTWTAAKKMMKLSRNLHHLPRYSIHPYQSSRFLIKRQPHPTCLSTIESIYYYLEEAVAQDFEDLKKQHQVLLDILQQMVAFQLECTKSSEREGYRRNTSKSLKDQRFITRKNPRRTFFD
jgi:DTW domain-containing protein YfiP